MSHPYNVHEAALRLDAHRVSIRNPQNIPVTLFARNDVLIEPEGVRELQGLLSLQDTLTQISQAERSGAIRPFFGDIPGRIEQVVLTPDFHKGAGIPVGTVIDARGFVLPRAVGNDICCGMRLLSTDVRRDELLANLAPLKKRLREIFFQGKRDIPMSSRQREALLRDGLQGLHTTSADNQDTGAWADYDPSTQRDDLARAHFNGTLHAQGTFAFDSFIRASGSMSGRDPQIGSIGGGNHFVELQSVEDIADGATAHAWGVTKGQVTLMVHSGSVGLGHMVGGYFDDQARALFPAGLEHPKHGFYPLPIGGPQGDLARTYLDAMRNAANFAFGNRLFLGLMVLRALREVLGRDIGSRLVYDAPHNLIFENEGDSSDENSKQESRFIHRKGATPAQGADAKGGPFQYLGRPVIIPGSMGSSSFLMAGGGNDDALCSACHGAGRGLTRGQASHVDDETYREAMGALSVVTPIDPESTQVRWRRDILARYHQRMKEEAPYAYKPITPVIETVEGAQIARRVARLWPLVTLKG